MGLGGDYRDSRCLSPSNRPQILRWAVIDGDERAVVSELQQAIAATVRPDRIRDAVGQMRALLGRVERCEALDPSDVQNIARNRDLWELRIDDQAFGVHVRIYVTEISELPHDLIALHAHAKFVDGDEEEIRTRQNAAIDLATRRWAAGRRELWGLI